MWADRTALGDLALESRTRILDVGCGTGELSRVLREESDATVIGLDADIDLLQHIDAAGTVRGDALRLPFSDDTFDLVVCQALLVNLPTPVDAIHEFARVSSDLVGAIEPDNAAVTVDSTVATESALTKRARRAYIQGVDTDVTLGAVPDLFRDGGLTDISMRVHEHRQRVTPPYADASVESAARKASGERLDEQRTTMLQGDLDPTDFAELRTDWRAMGRETVRQMQAGEYNREEMVPFHVTVGRVA